MSTEAPNPPLGPTLRELRTRRGLSIKAAAEQAGISPSFLSLVERSQSDLAMSRLMRLLTLYGASLVDLVDATHAPKSEVIRGGEERAGRRFRVRNESERVARVLGCGHQVMARPATR
jgi:transcriptional regulator with XRE-family HTH domain